MHRYRARTKIEKLGIRGIRSFSPASQESMLFNTPLTLIVGYNGSGKTTIIETLKYATTGEQPPNSKGGAFIHDPKLCGEKEVLAQVRLSFQSTVGQKLVVTRSLQLTMKKTQRSLKTLDGSLVIYNNGERTGLSTKVGELDELVPNYLGVSPAILESVIFCHQEESMWPMSEPAALKKKFDEIFEAMKYTKAIDNLKVVRKKQGEELTRLKLLEATNKATKEKGQRAEKYLAALQTQIEDLREQSDVLSREREEFDALVRDRHSKAATAGEIVEKIRSRREQIGYRRRTAAKLLENITVRKESDEWLEQHLQEYKEEVQRMEAEKQRKQARLKELQTELDSSRRRLGDQQTKQGKHQSEKELYERQLQDRIRMVHAAAQEHEIRGFESDDLRDNHVQDFMRRIEKVLADKTRDIDRLKRENARELEVATSAITEQETKKAGRVQDRIAAKDRIVKIDRSMASLQADIKRLNVDEGAIAVYQSTFDDLEARLRKANEDIQASGIDGGIEQENARILQLENESQKLNRDLVEYTRRAADRAQLDLRKKEAGDRRRRLDTLTSTWSGKLANILGDGWKAESIDADFQSVLQTHVAQASSARKNVDASQQELKQVEYKLSTIRDRQKKASADLARCQSAVLQVLKTVKAGGEDGAPAADAVSIEEYQDELDNLESEILAAEKDISLFDHLKDYYSKSQKVINRFNKCSLCDRSFAEQPRERSKLLEKIAKNLDDKQKKELEEEKDLLEQNLGQLRAVRAQYDTYMRLETEQPGLRDELKAAEAQRDALVRHLEDYDAVFKQADEKRLDVEAMSKTVTSIAQAMGDVADSEKQIEKLESQQQQSSSLGASSHSADEIQELQAACSDQLRSAQTRAQKLVVDRQRMLDNARTLQLERSELKNKIDKATGDVERKASLLGQIQALKDETAQQRVLIQQTDADLDALEPEIERLRSIRQATLGRGNEKELSASHERDVVAQSVSELKRTSRDIDGYTQRGGPDLLAANERDIAQLQQAIADTERDARGLDADIIGMDKEIDNSDREKKNISDNLEYRDNERVVEKLAHELAELEDRNAQDDYDRLAIEARDFEARRDKVTAERAAIWGSMKSKDDELTRLLEEYDQEYKDAEQRYRESHIRVETTKAAIDDLGRYSAALDKAIMEYHALKMEEVNRIAGELWRATYQGTDIDTILIRSDNESAVASATKRNYNYRVCMVKQDTEMDMRGRCSAGQKMLASIIIRLALAESFGVNCGLIALDEPTTNLDSDNIRSLAVALHAIIQARQAQANFQLIVITHDEEFLRHMRCSDFCYTFYRVARDDRQNSIITREPITQLMEG